MLKLKRVEIQGFKSFYERTEMKFNGNGIAAVVGPNGCGKSNLSDAISWVLGEQSVKSLRGARMEDVIFAGTRDRKPLSMASVTMTMIPDEAALAAASLRLSAKRNEPAAAEGSETTEQSSEAAAKPVDAEVIRTANRLGEVTITRRLYRSGESEYLMNGKTVRLRDIQELFLGTGLGPESYAIIEQGRIGQILSNKPQDRRNVIEEAAGITKFKTRKRLAEAKLESAKQNLARVFDILEEVTRQVNSLRRQAAKTKRYGELRNEATGYLRQVLTSRFHQLEAEITATAADINALSTELQTLQTDVAAKEADQTVALEKSYATESELTTLRKQLADLQLEAERARGRLEYQTRQIEQIAGRLVASEAEALELNRQSEETAVELEQQSGEVAEIDARCEEARQDLEEKQEERQQAQAHLQEQERGLEGMRQNLLRLLGESSSIKNRTTQTEARLSSADREQGRIQAEADQGHADLERVQAVQLDLGGRLTQRQAELHSLAAQRKEVESNLGAERSQLAEARQVLDRVRGELSRVRARRESLDDVIQHRSYTTETVKRLFTAIERGQAEGFKPVGVLADFIEVEPQYEKAAEEFLHDELEFVIVQNWTDAERGVELMRGELGGRATFVVETSGDTADPSIPLPDPDAAKNELRALRDAVRFSNGLSKISVNQIPRLGYCYLAADRSVAQRFSTAYPHCWFLTNEGVSFHGQAVSGGKKAGTGPLALKRELRELVKQEQSRQQEVEGAEGQLEQLETSIHSLAERLETLRTTQQMQEKEAVALDLENRKLAEEFARAQGRVARAEVEMERTTSDRSHLESSLAHDRDALVHSEELQQRQQGALEEAREALGDLQATMAETSEEHATFRATLAALEERQRALSSSKARLESRLREFTNRRERLVNDDQRLTAERANFLQSNEELRHKLAEFQARITDTDGSVRVLVSEEIGLRASLNQLEDQLRALRQEVHASQEKRSELQVRVARSESDRAHLEETCLQELSLPLAEVAAVEQVTAAGDELSELEAKYQEVRRKIDALGPVNPQALEEFEESQQRQEFLSSQRQDLLDSIRDTERAIGELDAESRKRFGEAFNAINAHFREMFKTLFGGGLGEMRLTDEENLAESGIEIVASPPGKRLQSVLLLSGGEKSLTAMALLMGIFQYAPSPFCILDEIDAPLDEPNIERLTKLLLEMSDQTQFIVITHAKRTMEAAQSLYGVTMQEPGVSKLVSVKLKPFVDAGRSAKTARTTVEAEEIVLA